jgi:coenzyme F420-reducing hydrogenase beta subunit
LTQHFPDPLAREERLSPRDIVRSGLCIGCGSCVSDVPEAAMRFDGHGLLKPEGPPEWYRARTAGFAKRCPFSPGAANEDTIALGRFPRALAADSKIGRFDGAYVGHVAEEEFRLNGSSGGMVTWVAAELLRTGRVDAIAHVGPSDPKREGRFFRYGVSRSPDELNRGAKSRYYPIELSEVLREIRAVPGRYAVVGVPCFIKAIHLLRRSDPVIAERVTHTLGLFCGHMKSARFVESFAWQLGQELDRVRAVDYRIKDAGRPANWYRAHLTMSDGSAAAQDWWHLVDGDWGAGFFQASACNFCDDVVAETADIAFGDAWVEPYSSDGKGTNVVVVRSPELHRMVEEARAAGRLELTPVDAAFIEETQAAGFRHRREGLAYRLTWWRRGVRPRKRVAPSTAELPWRRKLVYRMRAHIAAWSHRMAVLAHRTGQPGIYTRWGRWALTAYQALTYSRGPLGSWLDRVERRLADRKA